MRPALIPKSVLRPLVRTLREVPFHLQAPSVWDRRPAISFLPAYGPHGAALLRIYNIAKALRPLGWRVQVIHPKLTLDQRRRCLATFDPDLVVMQGARHALNRPDFYPEWPVIYDMDDADFHLDHLANPVTRAMNGVTCVLAGSRYIADWCLANGAPAAQVVWTASPADTPPAHRNRPGPEVIAWTQTRPMTYVAEADLVRRFSAELAQVRPGLTLRLFDRQPGDDRGFADSFAANGLKIEWVASAPYTRFLTQLDDVSLGLAPLCPASPFNRGKGFGKVLAYIARGVPVIGSDAGEHGAFFTPQSGVISNNLRVWVDAADQILSDRSTGERLVRQARLDLSAQLSLPSIAGRIDSILRGYLADDMAKKAG